jgi:hypothetical protein
MNPIEMKPTMHTAAFQCTVLTLAALCSSAAWANDFPTVDRVLYVQECIAARPAASNFEMVNKCSCALDALAAEVTYDDYVQMSTVVKSMSIGGERGGTIRDAEPLKVYVTRYRELQAKVQKACFLQPPSAK